MITIGAKRLCEISRLLKSQWNDFGDVFFNVMQSSHNDLLYWDLVEQTSEEERKMQEVRMALEIAFQRLEPEPDPEPEPRPIVETVYPDDFREVEKKEHSKEYLEAVSKIWGMQQERKLAERYEKKYEVKVFDSQESRKKEILPGVWVIGAIDGKCEDHLIEFKNRKYKLFDRVKDYERCQCEVYMRLWEMPLKLVECYQGEINVLDVQPDDYFWEFTVIEGLKRFMMLYNKVIGNRSLYTQVYSKHRDRKLTEYLAEIERSIPKQYDLDLDCM